MAASAADAAAAAPRAIAKLPEHVVNRIAAGEIIQRPSNALKELIENALDAGATSIRITVKDGGLKLLQIQDNGSGIRKDDLPILCERFTTSKIKAFEDLSSLGTYGFRGEALASISHVAHLIVTTKTRDETCAWKAAYADGDMVPVKSGSKDSAPVPCAGNDGTVLAVEDLFYNTPQRLKALRSAADEYARILQVVIAYSIHNAGVAMSCKKASAGSSNATADVNTTVGASTLDNIGATYGEPVKSQLFEVAADSAEPRVKLRAWCSGTNYQGKKGRYLFFINNRYVDCSPLKRALEAFYSNFLAKGTHPFVYLSLELDPNKVDPNVHPTKKEVGFEDETEIVELVCERLADVLASQGDSRSFKVQVPPRPSSTTTPTTSTARKPAGSSSSKPSKVAPNKLVRTDAQSQTLDGLFPTIPSASKLRKATTTSGATAHRSARVRIAQSECALTSVKQLRKEVLEARHQGLEDVVKNHIFVGVADYATSQSAIQHGTKLYLANHAVFAEELFYQLGLRQFGRFSRVRLKPAHNVRKLLHLAVDKASANGAREGKTSWSSDKIVEHVYTSLFDARAMLDEYFAFGISDDGALESLPLVLPGYQPDILKLPLFLLRLGAHVDWQAEKPCFDGFLRELAFFHSPAPSPDLPTPNPESQAQAKHAVEHILWPTMRQYLVPSDKLIEDKAVVLVTKLEHLYRTFERC
ncbi:uncharacterized protein RHOBADRAFT_29774 [Rhodotorula graminis WP1]|uniref:DNA mismatch repair protein S5 domain-containing protein n=1 Tax=Rhodotorula graminis (strain WP1) TaxID=578459 RepID=A0A0P9ELJ5_RHOGW|nr:uncharacterized protein RHOBADRAFT_29774 [Rhodotorula graminis WP1]KPV72610.1 hypothetical protein RHOBADRAFT_29774 [Rhodotorula graminis WP1]